MLNLNHSPNPKQLDGFMQMSAERSPLERLTRYRFQEQTEVGKSANHSEVVRVGRHRGILVGGDEEEEDEEEEKEQEEEEEEEDEDDDEEPLQVKAKVPAREADGDGNRVGRNG
jgi:hypothetical protein